MNKSLSIAVALLLVGSLVLAACAGQSPTQAPAPAQPPAPPQATQPPVKETVVVKETVPVKETVIVQPTAAPSATPTATPTPAPGPIVAPKPTSAGKLEFTIDFAPTTPRKGDNKVQVTMILHITGGATPFQVKEEGILQNVTKRVDGVEYTRDWQNCGFDQPITIIVTSADGQTATLKTVVPYSTYKCP